MMKKSEKKLFQMKVMTLLNLKMITTTLRLLTMTKKKQSQRTIMEMLH